MPTLYEQALVELRARLAALPGLGPAGVMRGDRCTIWTKDKAVSYSDFGALVRECVK